MLPSFTSGCREPVHPGVKDGNRGVSGNESTVPDNKNRPVSPILLPFLHVIFLFLLRKGNVPPTC